jgi:phage shock protein E
MLKKIKAILGMQPKADLGDLIRNGAMIIDVRSKGEYAGGHVKGSVNVPLNSLEGHLNKIKDKNTPIITCCASGMRSASAKSILKSSGFTNVHNGGSWMSVKNKIIS